MSKINKERFKHLEISDLLLNVNCYKNNKDLKKQKDICIELLEEKWRDEFFPLQFVLKNLYNKQFFNFDQVSTADFHKLYAALKRKWWAENEMEEYDDGWDD